MSNKFYRIACQLITSSHGAHIDLHYYGESYWKFKKEETNFKYFKNSGIVEVFTIIRLYS